MLGFCGSGYSGMQMCATHSKLFIQRTHISISQPDVRTIEGVLFDALVKIGAVSQDNADNPTKVFHSILQKILRWPYFVQVGLARAARTDAGVHAAGNLVSLKMIITIPGVRDIVARVNEELPPEIRLWDYVRTQNSFNARLSVLPSAWRLSSSVLTSRTQNLWKPQIHVFLSNLLANPPETSLWPLSKLVIGRRHPQFSSLLLVLEGQWRAHKRGRPRPQTSVEGICRTSGNAKGVCNEIRRHPQLPQLHCWTWHRR